MTSTATLPNFKGYHTSKTSREYGNWPVTSSKEQDKIKCARCIYGERRSEMIWIDRDRRLNCREPVVIVWFLVMKNQGEDDHSFMVSTRIRKRMGRARTSNHVGFVLWRIIQRPLEIKQNIYSIRTKCRRPLEKAHTLERSFNKTRKIVETTQNCVQECDSWSFLEKSETGVKQ